MDGTTSGEGKLFLFLDSAQGHKRQREDDGSQNVSDVPEYVRLRWDEGEMGRPSLALQRFIHVSRDGAVFRRAEMSGGPSREPKGTPIKKIATSSAQADAKRTDEEASVPLGAIAVGDSLAVIDCTRNAAGDPPSSSKRVFVFDKQASLLYEEAALEEELSELNMRETRFTVHKRQRSWLNIPEYYLRPSARSETASTPSSVSHWEAAAEEMNDFLLEELQGYLMPWEREEDIRQEYLQGIYCFPDHRLDDEYDSNAEDHEANDYPEEMSSRSETRELHSWAGGESDQEDWRYAGEDEDDAW